MRWKNRVPCITFHLKPARRSTNMPGGALARPGGRPGLRTPTRKATEFGFRTQTPGPEIQKVRPGRPARFAYACPQTH